MNEKEAKEHKKLAIMTDWRENNCVKNKMLKNLTRIRRFEIKEDEVTKFVMKIRTKFFILWN